MIADQASEGYPWISLLALVVTGSGVAYTAYVTRRNAADQSASTDRKTGVEQFGVVGDLAVQISERIIDQATFVRAEERHDCDAKIEALKVEVGVELSALRAQVAECRQREEQWTAVLMSAGLLPATPNEEENST